MGRNGIQIVLELHIQDATPRVKCLYQLFDDRLVDSAFLLNELFVELVFNGSIQIEILHTSPFLRFLEVDLYFELSFHVILFKT